MSDREERLREIREACERGYSPTPVGPAAVMFLLAELEAAEKRATEAEAEIAKLHAQARAHSKAVFAVEDALGLPHDADDWHAVVVEHVAALREVARLARRKECCDGDDARQTTEMRDALAILDRLRSGGER